LEWLVNEDYNTSWSNRLGYPNKLHTKENVQLAQILNKHASMPIYVGLTLPPNLLTASKDNLYCTGLALKYSPTPIGHLTSLKSNWETLFKQENFSLIHKKTAPLGAVFVFTDSDFEVAVQH
jgi:hypothetical protein